MTVKELKEFYPEDKVIKEYGDALMKYNEDPFIYPYSEEEEKEMLYNTVEKMVYSKGIEQEKIETVKNFHELGIPLETIAKGTNLSVAEVKKILEEK